MPSPPACPSRGWTGGSTTLARLQHQHSPSHTADAGQRRRVHVHPRAAVALPILHPERFPSVAASAQHRHLVQSSAAHPTQTAACSSNRLVRPLRRVLGAGRVHEPQPQKVGRSACWTQREPPGMWRERGDGRLGEASEEGGARGSEVCEGAGG